MTGEPHDPSDAHMHDRRYKMLAAGLVIVVLAFAAISITVVVLTL